MYAYYNDNSLTFLLLTSGFVLVTHPVARLYFISFHMVCVLIILK